eukprot:TRINITY_DN7451_c1_g1_i1.p1 TRINITY_DN7451_c1_g1~~TRINITY_DN7451_c1_g1_i1.p1  ORF type:complete len:525 (+),score=77.20 TRINITY_DN7451_c1_g1_i1:11-1585(+)
MKGVIFLFVALCGLQAKGQCQHSQDTLVFYPGQSPYHQTGFKNGNAWSATIQSSKNEYLTYGPYLANVSSSQSLVVEFLLSIDNNDADDLEVVVVDVNDASVQQVITSKSIRRTDFGTAGTPQKFSLYFQNNQCSQNLEFRVFYVCCSAITHHQTTLRALDEGKLATFWNHQAHFEYISETNRSVAGAFILPVGNLWYFFYREQGYEPTPSYCSGLGTIYRIVVCTSQDEGRSWSSPPVVVAQPIPNTPAECGLVDGSPYYDNATSTWHYLSQCIARSGGWRLCHYFLSGSSTPLSLFEPNPHNPVVTGGQLFSQICSGTGKHCTDHTVDEGTPDIVKKVNGQFLVTFHGYDYTTQKGYRGAALTPNFVDWNVDSYDLPDDAIFSSIDCQNWNISWSPKNGGCIGGGEGTILISGDYYYQLIEAPDIELGCIITLGVQNWVLGLVRSPYMAPSGQWEEFQQNPIIIPKIKAGCSLQYHRLFYDEVRNNIYLSFIIQNFQTGAQFMKVHVLQSGYAPLPIEATAP